MRVFACMLNTDTGQYNAVYEEAPNGDLIGYGSDGIPELFGKDPFQVIDYFASKGEEVDADFVEFS